MSSLAGCNWLLAALGVLRDDHYPSFSIVKWQSSDLIGSLKSRLAVTKNDKNIAVSHQTLPSVRREKRRGTRLCKLYTTENLQLLQTTPYLMSVTH